MSALVSAIAVAESSTAVATVPLSQSASPVQVVSLAVDLRVEAHRASSRVAFGVLLATFWSVPSMPLTALVRVVESVHVRAQLVHPGRCSMRRN